MFAEADRRDPSHQRVRVALVDGNNHQIDRIKKEAKTRKLKVTILIDVIHVIEYLLYGPPRGASLTKATPPPSAGSTTKPGRSSRAKAGIIAASIRRKATRLKLDPDKRENADRAADYLLAKRAYLDYPTALANGWPIATGVIEGRHDRLPTSKLSRRRFGWRGRVMRSMDARLS
jgi:hypothetical protein